MPSPSDKPLRTSVIDGSFWAAMVGFGELFFQPLMLALVLGERFTALVTTLPGFLGAALCLGVPWLVERVGSHKKVAVWCAGMQSLMFLPLMAGAFIGWLPGWLVIVILGAYWFGGLAAGIAWSTWISTLVPEKRRATFFSFRNRMIWIFQLTTVLLGGFLLNHLPDTALGEWMIATFKGFQGEHGRELAGLSILMLIALFCRLISTYLLASIPEPEPLPAGPDGSPHRYVSPLESLRNITHSHESKLIAYFLMMAFASNISLGFLVPWMLGPIGQPAHHQAFLMGSLMLGRIVIYFFSGSFINRLGPRKVFLLAATGVVFAHAPLLLTPGAAGLLDDAPAWIGRNPELAFVMLVQFVAGMVQAVYDLTSWLLLIRHTQPHERTSMTATCWSGFWAAGFLGTAVGGVILQQGGFAVIADPSTTPGATSPKAYTYDGYLWLFAISTALRLLTLIPLWTWVRRLPEQ